MFDDDVIYVGRMDQADVLSDEDAEPADYGDDEDCTMGAPAGETEAGL
jgi:hypothetical protein